LGDDAERALEKAFLFEDIRADKLKDTIAFFESYNYMNA
jgi:hypothetical protein